LFLFRANKLFIQQTSRKLSTNSKSCAQVKHYAMVDAGLASFGLDWWGILTLWRGHHVPPQVPFVPCFGHDYIIYRAFPVDHSYENPFVT
jgi:hypothetical protein